jgi:hypothetical protein
MFGEFGLLELCMLNLFKFHIKVLKIKRKSNSLPLGSLILTRDIRAVLLTLDHRLHRLKLWLRWGAEHLCSMEKLFLLEVLHGCIP